MPVIALIVLSLAFIYSCASTRKMNGKKDANDITGDADSADVFIPLHPPVVVPHSWRDSLSR